MHGDPATELSRAHLIDPLIYELQHETEIPVECLAPMTKAGILAAMEGESPDRRVVMTATHGELQEPNIGSLKLTDGALTGSDIGQDWQCQGLVIWAYACCSAGGPREFPTKTAGATLAALPQKLLASGALGFIGYIGEVSTYLFDGPTAMTMGPQPGAIIAVARQLLAGVPIGHAMDYLHQMVMSWSSLIQAPPQQKINQTEMTELILACMDGRKTILLGDPATRLCVILTFGWTVIELRDCNLFASERQGDFRYRQWRRARVQGIVTTP